MRDMYPQSGKKLKKMVHIFSFIGYLLSDLLGLSAGLGAIVWLGRIGVDVWVQVLGFFVVGGLVAAAGVLAVWLRGLFVWNVANASEHAEAVHEEQTA